MGAFRLSGYYVSPHSRQCRPLKLLCTIDARREASGDQGIGSAVERDILDDELAELAIEWMMNPESPRVPNLSRIR